MAYTLGNSKLDVLGVTPESTEGTLLAPTGVGDYATLQPGSAFVPSFETLENEEIRASIGVAKAIQGLETPTAQVPHYLKHSGTEGTKPEISDFLKSLFGTETSNSTQRTATTGSTVSVIALGAGGSDFARGFAVLVKDATNGYRIRPVHSVSSNNLTLGFNLPTGMAPASGTGMGKCVNYSPANSDHISMSLWRYGGSGHVIEAIAGAKCVGMAVSSQARQLINGTFSFQGVKFYWNPIEITSSTKYIDINVSSTDYAASVEVKWYRDPYELANAVEDALNALGHGLTFTVTFNSTLSTNIGKFTIAASGSFNIEWATGTNTANTIGTKLGFSVAADDTGAATYTADNSLTYAVPHTPTYDTADPVVAKYNEVLLGDAADYECFEAANIDINIENTNTKVPSICAESGVNAQRITRRLVTVNLSALLNKHEADKFARFRQNSNIRFCYNWGQKDGGNWTAGTCMSFYLPTATVTAIQIGDLDSVKSIQMTLQGYVDSSSNGEVYLNFL